MFDQVNKPTNDILCYVLYLFTWQRRQLHNLSITIITRYVNSGIGRVQSTPTRVILFGVFIYYADYGFLGAKYKREHSKDDYENVLPDDKVGASKSDVPVGDDFDESRSNETEDGEAERSDDTHEWRDSWDCDSEQHADRYQDSSHYVVSEVRPLRESVFNSVPHDLNAYEELKTERAVDGDGDGDFDNLCGAERQKNNS